MPHEAEVQRAEEEALHRIYTDLLGLLRLSPQHREALRRRGLPDAEIERREYRSLPVHGRAELVRRLAEKHGDALLRVPGFFIQQEGAGRWWSLAGAAGLVIPVRDLAGRIVALKVRADSPGDAPRYTWISSAKQGGPGPGNRLHCPLFLGDTATVRITEGELKADIATALTGVFTLSIPGVSSWRAALPVLREVGAHVIRLAFDADARANRHVAKALKRTAKTLLDAGYTVEMEVWTPDGAKGIDDALAAGAEIQVLREEAALAAIDEIARAAGEADPGPHEAAVNLLRQGARRIVEAAKTDAGAPFTPEAVDILSQLRNADPAEWERVRTALKAAGTHVRALDKAVASRQDARASAREGDPYFVDGNRTYWRKPAGEGDVPVLLANFAARIVEECERDDGSGETQLRFIIEGAHESGRPLPRIEISADSFPGMAWPVKHWGTRAIVCAGQATKDRLREAIQRLSRDVPRRHVFTHLGWRRIGDRWAYLHAGGAVGVEGVETDPPQALSRYVLPAKPDSVAEAVRLSFDLLNVADRRIAWPLWAAVYRAPIVSLLPAPLVLWLYGPTGSLKSTLSALALCHFGGPFTATSLPASWLSTDNSLEMVAFLAKDCLLVIDDYAPERHALHAADLEKRANRLVRQFGNQVARSRLRGDLTQAPDRPPRCFAVSTGEQLPLGIQSVAARILAVPSDRSRVSLEKLSQIQEKVELLPHAMAAYLTHLSEEYDSLGSVLREAFEDRRARFFRDAPHLRLPETVAHLLLGAEMGLALALREEVINEARMDELLKEAKEVFVELAVEHGKLLEEERPTGLFIRLLRTIFLQGRAHLRGRTSPDLPPRDAERWGWRENAPQGDLLGWIDDAGVYLLPEAAFRAVCEYARNGGGFPVRERTLRDLLVREGFIVAADPGRTRLTIKVSGVSQHVLAIRREAFDQDETR